MPRRQASPRKQAGFTLVEIAIVLVIIGLLLGGVLKGQELVNSAKVKNLANDFRSIPTMVYAYQDRFRRLPGDDPAAADHVGGVNIGDGDGRIEGNWDAAPVGAACATETCIFWEHVRRANLASGSTAFGADYGPVNAEGARVGITSDGIAVAGWAGNFYVCSAGIQGRFARQLDTTLDDGNTSTGSVRVIGENTVAAIAAGYPRALAVADDALLFTVCSSF